MIKIFSVFFAACILTITAGWAHAEAAPFGLNIGAVTYPEVRASCGERASLVADGTNRWTDGRMLRAEGQNLGLEGLQSVLLIFDKEDVLVGVILRMGKHRFAPIVELLAQQYRLMNVERPFVGDQSALLQAGPIRIEVDAPHLSFDMQVRYLHPAFVAAFEQGRQRERNEQRQRESGLL